MRSVFFIALSLALGSAITACTPYDPDLGPSPFLCGPADQDPRCPDGYTCQMMGAAEYCLAPSGTIPVDANNLNCADDSQLEPNDSYMNAFVTPVATQRNDVTFAGLAICPAGDKDNYSITITTATQNLEVLIEYDAGGGDLQSKILSSNGTPIANGSPTAAGMRRAYAANLPAGVYYAAVEGPMMGSVVTNNYKLIINVTGP